jgi:hypothetical protein
MTPRQRDRCEEEHGWMPPRVSTAEAIDQSVMIADRCQRSFLPLMKAFHDNRRLFTSLVVAGGQVNIAEQHVVSQEAEPAIRASRPTGTRPGSPNRAPRQSHSRRLRCKRKAKRRAARLNPLEFQRIWSNPPAFLSERAAAQSHFNDLCALFD